MQHIPQNFLGTLTFQPPKEVVLERMRTKIQQLSAKVSDRKARIRKIREENKIDDKALIELMNQVRRDTHAMSYRVSNFRTLGDEPTAERGTELVIPAGVAAALQAESDMVEDENKALARLRMMERNYEHVKEPIVVSLGDLDFLDM